MSHPQQIEYVTSLKNTYEHYFTDKKVLEVGSLDINGTVRSLFSNCDYTGIDVGPGKGVDLVCEGQDYDADEASFDTTISCECFEHNPYWKETFENMHRMTKSEGIVIMSCATTGRKEHGTRRSEPESSPLTVIKGWDYYKNLTEDDFRESFDLDSMFSTYEFKTNNDVHDLYFYGIKV